MSENYFDETMLEMYLFEMAQSIEQLEEAILSSEKSNQYSQDAINEIFRLMHTIKGSSAMMSFANLESLAHYIEDLFYFLREEKPRHVNCSLLSDLVFEGVDFVKVELQKIKDGVEADGDASLLISKIQEYLAELKQPDPVTDDRSPETVPPIQDEKADQSQNVNACSGSYKAVVHFQEGCEMENVRAYAIIHKLKEIAEEIYFTPEDIVENDDTVLTIRKQGFQVIFEAEKNYEEINAFFQQTVFLKELELEQLGDSQISQQQVQESAKEEAVTTAKESVKKEDTTIAEKEAVVEEVTNSVTTQSIINVSVDKLDKLMDLMGEIVIAEAMVTHNPDLDGLHLENFEKAARQLSKITSELQDVVMSTRMVTLTTTFHKMHRIVRDMGRKLGKEINLQMIGEDTEVDKKVIEHLSDPIMHLIRNAMDHGIESTEERLAAGKSKKGTITLEARNSGSDVLVTIKDDGKGLNKEKMVQQAQQQGLLTKEESELTEKDIYSMILIPGFSTKESVTEFSGRGVGMDVVVKNLEAVGGSVFVDSAEGQGTIITMKIPLTMAIIDGMNLKVGRSRYTIPISSVKDSFKMKIQDFTCDPDGNEMIMVRGQCLSIIRLHTYFKVKTDVTDFEEGILITVEQDGETCCLFADELLGQQEVVVKTLPSYINKFFKIKGISGCTLLGDGSISLILDISDFVNVGFRKEVE